MGNSHRDPVGSFPATTPAGGAVLRGTTCADRAARGLELYSGGRRLCAVDLGEGATSAFAFRLRPAGVVRLGVGRKRQLLVQVPAV